MKKELLNRNWIFRYSSGIEYLDKQGAAYKKTLDLPHDFMIATKRTPDAGTGAAGGYFQGGIGTYEKTLYVSKDQSQSQFWLMFEGAYGNTEVWINGNLAKTHHYGYTEFFADLTPWLRYGEENKIKIIVENNALPNSRWYTGAGLYRNIWLLQAPPVYLDPWSVFVSTPSFTQAVVEVSVTNTKDEQEIPVIAELFDSEDHLVACMKRQIKVPHGITKEVFDFDGIEFKPWSLENPYLYTARVQAGEDFHETSFGVRTIRYGRDGFFLNGKPVKLQGGCIHHDNGIAGACAFDVLEERKIRKLKESGYNAIRTAHNPMSTSLLNACDSYGMLVLDECFDCWNVKKNPFDFHLFFRDHWKEELQSMVCRDRNHPSVILYSIGNEIGERDGSSYGVEQSAEMCSFVRELDSTRGITNGLCAIFLDAGEFGGILANIFGSGEEIDFDSLSPELKGFLAQSEEVREKWGEITARFAQDLDVVGYNYLDERYEADGIQFPERVILGTESYPRMMKRVWERTMAHSYVLGDFNWTAYDYMGESGVGHAFYDQKGSLFCDYPFHIGNCGDYDLNGNLRPQGRFRRLLWGQEKGPVITVLKPQHFGKQETLSSWGWPDTQESWTWPGFEGKPVRLDIFSRAEEVEISINGKTIKREKVPESWILQTEMIYEPGEIRVTEYQDGKVQGKTSLKTAGSMEQLRITLEDFGDLYKDRDSLHVFQIEAVDAGGIPVPCAKEPVQAKLEGGQLIGFGNANPMNTDNYATGKCMLHEGRALLIARKKESSMKLRIMCNGKESIVTV